jgi:hypothetical protein
MYSIVAHTDIESNEHRYRRNKLKGSKLCGNNINSQNTAGDEGLDCHNSQDGQNKPQVI